MTTITSSEMGKLTAVASLEKLSWPFVGGKGVWVFRVAIE